MHTPANDGDTAPTTVKAVCVPTVMVCVPIWVVTRKLPVAPAVPHVPGAVEPFTAETMPPVADGNDGGTATYFAATAEPVHVPTAPANRPTQTFANDGAVPARYFVVPVTDTVLLPLGFTSLNDPAAPATPHVPNVATPLTEPTTPNATDGTVTAPLGPVVRPRVRAMTATKAADLRRRPRAIFIPTFSKRTG